MQKKAVELRYDEKFPSLEFPADATSSSLQEAL
jgi:hypothetical protein